MRQHINLLPREPIKLSPLSVALLSLAVFVLAALAAYGVNGIRLAASRQAEAVAANELNQAKALIQRRVDTKADLDAKIAALTPIAESAADFLRLVENLGTGKGYSDSFSTLAGVMEDGTWLTGLAISRSGKSLVVEGQAMDREAVMRLSRNLNTAFAKQGAVFTSLELQPESVGAPDAGIAPVTSMKFKIR